MGQRGGFGPSLDTKLYLFLYALGMTHGVENYKDWEKKKGRRKKFMALWRPIFGITLID